MPSFAARAAAVALALAPLLVPPGGASAQAAKPTVIEVRLSEFRFTPARIDLTQGQSYLLRLTNAGKHDHAFSAKAFFQAAALSPAATAKIGGGEVDVPEGQTVEIELTPATPGTYEMHCPRTMHSLLGMRGQIAVH